MKNKGYLLAVICLVFVMLQLTGCEMAKTPEELIRDPELPEKVRLVETYAMQSFQNELPNGVEITMPIRLNGNGAINFVDMNGDGVDEAVVLYKKAAPEASVGVLIMVNDGTWYTMKLIKLEKESDGKGNTVFDIHTIEFADINGDGNPELLVGCFLQEDVPKKLFVYTYTDGGIQELPGGELYYDDFTVCDLNGDGKDDIFTVTYKTADRPSHATLYTYQGEALKSAGRLDFAPEINTVQILDKGLAAKDTPAVFIKKVETAIAHFQILTYKNGQYISLYDAPQNQRLDFKDIDGDGILEIKIVEEMKLPFEISGGSPLKENAEIVTWNVYESKNKLKTVSRQYINQRYDYLIEIPPEWGDRFTIEDENEKSVKFLNVLDKTKIGGEYFTIAVVDTVEYNGESFQKKMVGKKFEVLASDAQYTYLVVAGDKTFGEDSIEYAKDAFHKLD